MAIHPGTSHRSKKRMKTRAQRRKEVEDKLEAKGKLPFKRVKYKTAKALEKAIDKYFSFCDPHIETHTAIIRERKNPKDKKSKYVQKQVKLQRVTEQIPYTMSGLALSIGLGRLDLLNYSEDEKFYEVVTRAKKNVENFAEGKLFSKVAHGAQFALQNNFKGWKDEKSLKHSGEIAQPITTDLENLSDEELDKLERDVVNQFARRD